jgi:hypothetical protein
LTTAGAIGSGTADFVISNTGLVGIGTTAPLSKLGVSGNLSVGATYGAIAAPTSGAIIEGNVGIGTTAPTALLSLKNGHIQTIQANAPTLSVSTMAWGTPIFVGYATDTAGQIKIPSVTNTSATQYVQLNFNISYNYPPIVILTATGSNSIAGNQYSFGLWVSSTTTYFRINFNNNQSAGDQYWNYYVIETAI